MAKYLRPQDIGRRYERSLSGKYGKPTPGSGNRWHAKNDLQHDQFETEVKYTGNEESYTLRKNDLEKLNFHAMGKTPVFVLNFSGDEYIIVRKKDWEALFEIGTDD